MAYSFLIMTGSRAAGAVISAPSSAVSAGEGVRGPESLAGIRATRRATE